MTTYSMQNGLATIAARRQGQNHDLEVDTITRSERNPAGKNNEAEGWVKVGVRANDDVADRYEAPAHRVTNLLPGMQLWRTSIPSSVLSQVGLQTGGTASSSHFQPGETGIRLEYDRAGVDGPVRQPLQPLPRYHRYDAPRDVQARLQSGVLDLVFSTAENAHDFRNSSGGARITSQFFTGASFRPTDERFQNAPFVTLVAVPVYRKKDLGTYDLQREAVVHNMHRQEDGSYRVGDNEHHLGSNLGYSTSSLTYGDFVGLKVALVAPGRDLDNGPNHNGYTVPFMKSA
ncbi:MAG: hypothetical protein H6729_14425 [Deltaproteobacteria bacterium]|nr:hypothetical protein [Deltaproteobacteria bacterium]